MVTASNAGASASSDSDFVGMYNQGGMESLTQLFLLDDHTFCFALMAGNLDLIKAGRWKAGQAERTIELQEIRPDTPVHPAMGWVLDRLGAPEVGINFDGYSLSDARSPVFAVTGTETPPATYRPLFPEGNSTWSGNYALPLIAPKEARYIFIGDVEVDQFEKPKRLRMTQYKIDHYDAIRIGFDRVRSEPPMSLNLRLVQNILWVGNEKFGSRKPLAPDVVAKVREQCINPALRDDKVQPTRERGLPPANERLLTPLKIFYLDLTAIAGPPFFDTTNHVETPATDSLNALVESEKNLLDAAYKRAVADTRNVDEFMSLAKAIAVKKNRIVGHAPQLVIQFAELLVATNAKGDLDSSTRIFHSFKENIYPAISKIENDKVSYALSVIASQGLIITTKVKNAKISDFIFEELLGKQFDITTHKNRTLIYNLACYHAINTNKDAMLEAIKQARRRGTPSKQFMDDTDFKKYWTDAEFLGAIAESTAK